MIFISVVRDFKMYHSLVKENPFNKKGKFIVFNNNTENISITKRYNSFLDTYDYSKADWFVFCHEDWEVKQKWLHLSRKLDKNSLYGVFGTKIKFLSKNFGIKYYYGNIEVSDKNGDKKDIIGLKVQTGTPVDTFDCMCIIIHSSLIKKYHLRFDENLSWHHYAEEFNIRLKEKFNIVSRILKIKCRHWSWGNANEEFDKSFNYVKLKFKKAKYSYSNTTNDYSIGEKNQFLMRVLKAPQKLIRVILFEKFLLKFTINKKGRKNDT